MIIGVLEQFLAFGLLRRSGWKLQIRLLGRQRLQMWDADPWDGDRTEPAALRGRRDVQCLAGKLVRNPEMEKHVRGRFAEAEGVAYVRLDT